MSTIKRSETWDELPQKIKNALEEAPLFYTKDYECFLRKESQVIYFYNTKYIQVVAIHTTGLLFKYAFFPSEAFQYSLEEGSSEKEFLNGVIGELQKMKIHWTSVTPASSVFTNYPDCSIRIPWGNYVIDLTLSEEELFKNVTSKHRNMIRRGEKNDIVIKYGGKELLKDYMLLDKQTWERSGQTTNNEPVYREYIDFLPHNAFIGIAYKDSIPQCGLLGLYSKASFYYEFGASAHRPAPGSTHYLQWKTILKMKAEGVLRYNFVGCRIDVDADTKLSNIQHFKAGFGGELVRSFLFKCELNKTMTHLFKLLLLARSGKYPKDVIDQERNKWKELNL